MKGIHKYTGYALIITSQIATLLGVISYNDQTGNPTLGAVNLGLFLLIWAILEIITQIKTRGGSDRGEGTSKYLDLKVMNVSEFQRRIAKGAKFVILDDLVLDVGDYAEEHPGGDRLLLSNIGRDISKFFYGGYSMGLKG